MPLQLKIIWGIAMIGWMILFIVGINWIEKRIHDEDKQQKFKWFFVCVVWSIFIIGLGCSLIATAVWLFSV